MEIFRQSAITADAFLDSFQKIADATTNSKGKKKFILLQCLLFCNLLFLAIYIKKITP